MASPEHITNPDELALARVLQQYVGKPRIEGQISAHAAQIQAVEDALWQLMVGQYLDAAEGVQLDRLGAVLVEPRGALGDAQYALVLAAKIRMLRSSGTVPDILAVFATLVPDVDFRLIQAFPASETLFLDDPIDGDNAPLFASFLARARVAGVTGRLVYHTAPTGRLLILTSTTQVRETLDGNHGAGAATLAVSSTTGFPASGFLALLGGTKEIVQFASKTATEFVLVGVTANAHATGSDVVPGTTLSSTTFTIGQLKGVKEA